MTGEDEKVSESTIHAREMGFKKDEFVRLRFLGEAGWLSLDLGQHDRATAIFEGIRILSPEDPVAHLGLGEAALARGDAKTARASALAAQGAEFATIAARALGLTIEARAELMSGNTESARELLQAAVLLDPKGSGGETARGLIEVFESLRGDLTHGRENKKGGDR